MTYSVHLLMKIFVVLCVLRSYTTIQVNYGTRPGPIEPPTTTIEPHLSPLSRAIPPAVYELNKNDIPNPKPYRPYLPYQYRNKIRASLEKAPITIYLGSELDQKYRKQLPMETIRKIAKYNALANSNTNGVKSSQVISQRSLDRYEGQPPPTVAVQLQSNGNTDYRGPQTFGPEHFQTVQSPYLQRDFVQDDYQLERFVVPQFGVLYSGGVRYYIPQLNSRQHLQDNSVYDRHDFKFYNK